MGIKLNFICKKAYTSEKDVSITIHGKKKSAISITLRNGSDKKITDTEHLSVAILEDRLYFRQELEYVGYKCSNSKGGDKKYVRIIDKNLLEWAETHTGDYILEYDRGNKLFFVDASL